jgi:hypothetical protein
MYDLSAEVRSLNVGGFLIYEFHDGMIYHELPPQNGGQVVSVTHCFFSSTFFYFFLLALSEGA